jgi:hypothetical protein
MIDSSNPVQVAWLNSLNQEIGNLTTSNHSLAVQNRFLSEEAAMLSQRVAERDAQIQNMGLANTNLREELTKFKPKRGR